MYVKQVSENLLWRPADEQDSPTPRLVDWFMANARDYFPMDFSWLLDVLNASICPSGEGLRCRSFWVKSCAGNETAAAEEPEYVRAGSSVRAGLEGQQLRRCSLAGLFNQASMTQRRTTKIREKGPSFSAYL